jgi:predicted GNAT family acetyltransferase
MRTPTSQFAIRDNAEQHRFEADLGDGQLAVAAYSLHGNSIAFTHTKVPPKHEGKGVGSALIRFSLDQARARGLTVMPACAFYAAYMKRHPEVQDLLEPTYRAKLGLR